MRLTARQLNRLADQMNKVSEACDNLGPEDSAFDALQCGPLGSEVHNLTRLLDGIRGPVG